VLYWRIAAVACTAFFVAVLVWLYGIRTTLIWAGAMAAFLLILWVATMPLRTRQRRVWREMGLGSDGRPLPDEEQDDETD
jgi:L-asparagine transporter-like permease